MAALTVHVLLGLFWLLTLAFLAADLGGARVAVVWVGSALVLWLILGRSVLSGGRPWRATFLWWAASLVAPLSLLLVAVRWRRSPSQEVGMAPDSTVVARLDEAEARLGSLEREARRINYVKPGERLFVVKGIPAWRKARSVGQ